MILFIDSTISNDSRTLSLAKYFLDRCDDEIVTIRLNEENILALNNEILNKRLNFINNKDYSDDLFKYASLLKKANHLVIASPYYDLSFSANLKSFIEAINVIDYTFSYDDNNKPYSLCNIDSLYYFTTAGGPIVSDEYGYGYLETMFKMFYEVKNFYYIKAENLDLPGYDKDKILNDTYRQIDLLPIIKK